MVPEYLRGLHIPPVCHTHAAPKWNQTRGIEIPGTTNTPLHNITVGQVSYEEGQRGRGAWVSKITGKKKEDRRQNSCTRVIMTRKKGFANAQ